MYDAVVLADVLCDTTLLVSSVAQGRATFAAASVPAAQHLARELRDPILASSEQDTWRTGCEMCDSPAALARRSDSRPLVLACRTGLLLATQGARWPPVYLLCLRNIAATARHLARHHQRVLVVDGVDDGDVRCEDQIAAGQLGLTLADCGFQPLGIGTRETMSRWGQASPGLATLGRSAEELRRRRRSEDVEFALTRVDDLDLVCNHQDGRLLPACAEAEDIPQIA